MKGQLASSCTVHLPRGRRRWFVFAAFAAATVAAAFGASPALANTTQSSVVQINVSDTVSGICPFDIAEHQEGSLKVTDFFDNNASITKTIVTSTGGAFVTTWSANGITATSRGTPVIIIVYNADGSVQTATNVGLILNFVVPGTGSVFAQTGKLVFDDEGNIIFQAGQNQLVEGDTAALCAALS